MKKNTLAVLSTFTMISLLASCGGGSSSGGGSGAGSTSPAVVNTPESEPQKEEEAPQLDGSHIQGHYQAKFVTLNAHVNGTIPGAANFVRKDDKLYAYIRLFAGRVKAWHQQFVYEGTRCPTMQDDTNGDGFLDIQEAEAVTGKILIPMDSDISSQASGRRFFPLADLSGYYHYERITSFSRFLSDLQAENKDPNGDTTKLAPGQPLILAGKVFMVLGVDEATDFPDSVASKGRHRAFQTFPIACGVYEKMPEAQPGATYNPNEIGPVAEVDPDQDRPATDVIPDSTGGSTSGHGTGNNDSDDGDGPVSDGEGDTRTTSGSTSGTTTGGASTGGSTSSGTTGGAETTGGTTGSTGSGETTDNTNSTSTGETTGGFLDSRSGV